MTAAADLRSDPGRPDDAITQSRMERLRAGAGEGRGPASSARASSSRRSARTRSSSTPLFGAFERDVAAGGGVLAGAVAFRVFLFMIPYVFLLVVIFGLGASAADEDPGTLAREAGIGGLAAKAFAGVGDLSTGQRIVSFFVAGFALLLATRALLKVLRIVHALVWHTDAGKVPSTARAAGMLVLHRDRRAGDLGADREAARRCRSLAGLLATLLFIAHPGGGVALRELAHAPCARHAVDGAAPRRGGVRSRSRGAPPRHRVLDREPDRAQDRHLRRHRLRAGAVALGVPARPPHHVGGGGQRDAVGARRGAAPRTRRARGPPAPSSISPGRAPGDGARSGRPEPTARRGSGAARARIST